MIYRVCMLILALGSVCNATNHKKRKRDGFNTGKMITDSHKNFQQIEQSNTITPIQPLHHSNGEFNISILEIVDYQEPDIEVEKEVKIEKKIDQETKNTLKMIGVEPREFLTMLNFLQEAKKNPFYGLKVHPKRSLLNKKLVITLEYLAKQTPYRTLSKSHRISERIIGVSIKKIKSRLEEEEKFTPILQRLLSLIKKRDEKAEEALKHFGIEQNKIAEMLKTLEEKIDFSDKKLSAKESLVLTLENLWNNISFKDLGDNYGVSDKTASNVTYRIKNALDLKRDCFKSRMK